MLTEGYKEARCLLWEYKAGDSQEKPQRLRCQNNRHFLPHRPWASGVMKENKPPLLKLCSELSFAHSLPPFPPPLTPLQHYTNIFFVRPEACWPSSQPLMDIRSTKALKWLISVDRYLCRILRGKGKEKRKLSTGLMLSKVREIF